MTQAKQPSEDWYLVDGQPRFSMVPVWVTMSMVRGEVLRVYAALASFADGKDRLVWPGKESIARRAGRSLRFVPKAIRELEEIGAVIVTERPGQTNLYGLPLDPPRDAHSCTPRRAHEENYVPNNPNEGVHGLVHPRDAQTGQEGCTDGLEGMHGGTSEETEETYEETNKDTLVASSDFVTPPPDLFKAMNGLMARQSLEALLQDSSPGRPLVEPGSAPADYCGVRYGDFECSHEHAAEVGDWESVEVGT